jgi:hypothetical protein
MVTEVSLHNDATECLQLSCLRIQTNQISEGFHSLEYEAMEKLAKGTCNLECYTPSSEPFRTPWVQH